MVAQDLDGRFESDGGAVSQQDAIGWHKPKNRVAEGRALPSGAKRITKWRSANNTVDCVPTN